MARRLHKRNKSPDPAPPGLKAVALVSADWKAFLQQLRYWLPRTLVIVALTLWIYWPALRGELIWDDQWYITMNPLLHDLAGLWKFWFQPGNWVEYYPIEETVIWIQWHLWGNDTLGYHLTDVFLHIVNALLVWHFFTKFRLKFAWLGGLIFAIHPVQVESVAYISELKNTLFLPAFILTMEAWIDYEETGSSRDYRKALGLFLIAMLCKITMAPFAAIILLYAWWKRGRIGWRDVKGCVPFLLIAVVLGAITVWAGVYYEKANYALIGASPLGGLLSRIDAAGLNATVYFARCFLPVNILFVYSQWPLHPHAIIQYVPWFVFAAVLYALWRKRRGWGRHVLLGLGFFLIFLAPFLGFVSVSYMNFIWVMDHLLYLPIIGLIGLALAGCDGIDAQLPASFRPLTRGAVGILVAFMVWGSHAFAGLFAGEMVLWPYILDRNPTVWLAHDSLALKLMELDRFPEAMVQINDALALRPNYWDGYFNKALVLEKFHRPDEAEVQYRQALKLNPECLKAYLYLGEIVRRSGHLPEAEAIFRQGLKVAPDDVSLNTSLAGMMMQTSRIPEAAGIYEHLVELNPDLAQIQYNLGIALLQTGNLPEAAEHLQAAVTLDPKITAAHKNLGAVLAQTGHLPEAIEQFEAFLQVNPSDQEARANLALALAQTGHVPEAIEQYQIILQADPADAKARENLGRLQQFEMQQKAAGKN